MNRLLRLLAIHLLSCLCLHGAQAANLEDNPGYLDPSRLAGIAGRKPSVEVTLTGPVLKMLLQLPDLEDTDAAEALALLKVVDQILVRVFPLENEAAADVRAFITETSTTLEGDNWSRIVRVREDEDFVDIHVKLSPDGENLNGLTIMALDGRDADPEVVFVNIVGNFNPAYLANIGQQFDIDYLDDVEIP